MASRPKRTAYKAERRAARKKVKTDKRERAQQADLTPVEFKCKNKAQQAAIDLVAKNDISFLLGSAGSGKTFLAMAYAINEILNKRRSHIILTRPIVEAGERLGFLPGTFGDKVNPYMQPLYDTMDILLGKQNPKREIINRAVVLAPLCYMRGRTFNDAVCIFDEAQNATYTQLKLFLTRFGENTKVIVTGDPQQSDLFTSAKDNYCALVDVTTRLKNTHGISVFEFANSDVVRHPLVGQILKKL
jgi:phosphate starvation-inducible PhoH-like protein